MFQSKSIKFDEVKVLNPLESLSKIIPEVREKSDLIVLLFNANDQDILKLQNSDFKTDFLLY